MLAALMIAAAVLQPQAPAVKPEAPAKVSVVERLRAEAEKLGPLVKTDAGRAFLRAAEKLKDPGTRTVYRSKDKSVAVSAEAWAKLPAEKQAELAPRECTPEFYYYTGYGSPLVYVRVVELMAEQGLASLEGKRVLDFGYGTIGHLQAMAWCGAEAHGVDVEPMFEALYSRPTDLEGWDVRAGSGGATPSAFGPKEPRAGVAVHTGRWPADPGVKLAVSFPGPYDVITSKNTLKAGYIHPSPPKGKTVDEKQLVKLGVGDGVYLKAVHDALKPGGLFIIYNICPAQSPAEDAGKPYLPMADGKSPFTREQFAAAGFEVLTFDREDQAWVLDCWKVLGYDGGKARDEAAKDVFAWCTVAKRK